MNEGTNPLIVVSKLLDYLRNSTMWFLLSYFVWPIFKQVKSNLHIQRSKNIVSSMKDESDKEILFKSLQMFIEMYRAMLPVAIFLGIVYTLLFFIYGFELSYNVEIAIAFIILFVLVAASIGVRRLEPKTFGKRHMMIMLILVDVYILLMLANFYGDNVIAVYTVIAVTALITYIGVSYGTQDTMLLKKYIYKSVKCLKAIRSGMAIAFLGLILVGMVINEWTFSSFVGNIYFGCWIVLYIIEWVIIEIKDKNSLINYKIVLRKEEIYTQKKVVQHNSKKVIIFLNDGSKRIVDNKEIKYIEYYLNTYFVKKDRHKVVCIYRGEGRKEYNRVKYLNDNWVHLYKNHNGGCIVTIVNDARIKEIQT